MFRFLQVDLKTKHNNSLRTGNELARTSDSVNVTFLALIGIVRSL